MVLADSHGPSRIPCYSGVWFEEICISHTGLLPPAVNLSRVLLLYISFVTSWTIRRSFVSNPTTSIMHRRQAISHYEFRLAPLRSPLLRGSQLLSFPWGTEMFQFAQFPLPNLWPFGFQLRMLKKSSTGFPIRRSSSYNAWSTTPRGLSQSPTSFIGI